MAKKSKEEVTGVATLESPESDVVVEANPSTSTVVRYWSPEHENLIVGYDPLVKFENNTVVLDVVKSPKSAKALEQSNVFNQLFFRVHDRAGDDDYKIDFGRRLRRLLGNDPEDQVTQEKGYMAIMALFTPDELIRHGISKGVKDVERLIYATINNKYVEGIV
jgi:hypothetical protein